VFVVLVDEARGMVASAYTPLVVSKVGSVLLLCGVLLYSGVMSSVLPATSEVDDVST